MSSHRITVGQRNYFTIFFRTSRQFHIIISGIKMTSVYKHYITVGFMISLLCDGELSLGSCCKIAHISRRTVHH